MDTAWARGSRILFGQMYEDSALERKAFAPDSRVFAIASAGCTAMALATSHRVTAVDINPAQLAYASLRAAGSSARFGVADRLLKVGRNLAGWNRALLERFVNESDCGRQLDFWQQHLHTPRFRTVFDGVVAAAAILFSRLAKQPDSLPREFARILRGRLERGLARYPNRTNPYAGRLLAGRLPDPCAAPSIQFHRADAATFLEASPPSSFDAFTLSNIADGITGVYRDRLAGAIRHAASPGAVFVLRTFREPANAEEGALAAEDRSFIWGAIRVGPARSF